MRDLTLLLKQELAELDGNLDLVSALTHSLDCAEALVETGLDANLKEVDPLTARMYLSSLLRVIQATKKLSTEIFLENQTVH